jgi:hypothetical protein
MEILLTALIKLSTLDSLVTSTNHLSRPVVESRENEKPPKKKDRGEGRRDE